MKSIKNEVIKEFVINKSTFINYLKHINSVDDAKAYLNSIKDQHKDANHHCYAYIIGEHQEIQKFSDDGEPSKTAGLPMMEVLKKHDLTNVINISVRYFGGIKLGAGGLVRAYTKGCAESVKDSEEAVLSTFYHLDITIPFDLIGVVEKHIRDHYTLIDTTYDQFVHYQIEIEASIYEQVTTELIEKTSGQAQCHIKQEFKKYT